MLRIDELITALKKARHQHGDLQVCKTGYYGEILDMDLSDIGVRDAQEGVFGEGKKHTVLELNTPDIGPEPD